MRKVFSRISVNDPRTERRSPLVWFSLALVAFILSLTSLVRVSAMPAEARTQENWFSYSEEMRMDFTAQVIPGRVYPGATVRAEELYQSKLPVDPPAYRRILVSKLTESIIMQFPYRFVADRPADITATYRVDGTLAANGLWRRPYPLLEAQQTRLTGTELILEPLTIQIPVREIVADMQALSDELRFGADQVEVKVRPVVQVQVAGLKEPVTAGFQPEFTVLLRGNDVSIEVDEPRLLTNNQTLSSTTVKPLYFELMGLQLPVGTVRTVAISGLTILALVLGAGMALQWLRRRAVPIQDLRRLGASLIEARTMELPPGAVVIEVQNLQQLVHIHLRTDRPVVRVGATCYLVDGSTCYRLTLPDEAAPAAD